MSQLVVLVYYSVLAREKKQGVQGAGIGGVPFAWTLTWGARGAAGGGRASKCSGQHRCDFKYATSVKRSTHVCPCSKRLSYKKKKKHLARVDSRRLGKPVLAVFVKNIFQTFGK